jgi:hypothetical protein
MVPAPVEPAGIRSRVVSDVTPIESGVLEAFRHIGDRFAREELVWLIESSRG